MWVEVDLSKLSQGNLILGQVKLQAIILTAVGYLKLNYGQIGYYA